jgi:hypothetical protein
MVSVCSKYGYVTLAALAYRNRQLCPKTVVFPACKALNPLLVLSAPVQAVRLLQPGLKLP